MWKTLASKWELVLLPFWIIAVNLVVLSPAILLAVLTYRWNKGLLALVHNPEEHEDAPETPFRAGLWLFRKSIGRLSPPWYAILAFLVLALIVHALHHDEVSTLHKLHWLGLHLSVEIAAILATFSGTMLFARRVKNPGELLWVGIFWVVGWWFAVLLFTQNDILRAMHMYYGGERSYTSVPLNLFVLPVYAAVMFVVCLYRTGQNLVRTPRNF
jgi:hypothetical protein